MICFDTETQKTKELKFLFDSDAQAFENKAKAYSELRDDYSLAQEDTQAIYTALKLSKENFPDLFQELIGNFKAAAKHRYESLAEPLMTKIKAGQFQMGTTHHGKQRYVNEFDAHPVTLNEFMISRSPVTQEMMSKFLKEKNMENGQLPAIHVTWYDSYLFCLWLDLRLPTEAEWEYCLRAGSDDEWFCDFDELPEYVWYAENANGKIQEVKTLKPNNWGIYDLAGNTWEWCLDSAHLRQTAQGIGTRNPCLTDPSDYRCCRGGSIHSFEEMLRSGFRFMDPPSFDAHDLGFRLVKSDIHNQCFI
jgi:formylglycine-generating enzyme required for sulfatase activity